MFVCVYHTMDTITYLQGYFLKKKKQVWYNSDCYNAEKKTQDSN